MKLQFCQIAILIFNHLCRDICKNCEFFNRFNSLKELKMNIVLYKYLIETILKFGKYKYCRVTADFTNV